MKGKYRILDAQGNEINVIEATQAFVDQVHPNRYELVIEVEPEPPAPVPKPLTRLEFIRLIQTAGGATQSDVVRAKKDLDLEYIWLVFDVATYVDKNDPDIGTTLDALLVKGYITDKQAVLDAWPVK